MSGRLTLTPTSDVTYIWSTFDHLATVKEQGEAGDFVLQRDRVSSFVPRPDKITLDTPERWKQTNHPIVLRRGSDELWKGSNDVYSFEAARAGTAEAIVLTGRWRDSGYGGPFILVHPRG